jgi:hypothetical protein
VPVWNRCIRLIHSASFHEDVMVILYLLYRLGAFHGQFQACSTCTVHKF